MRQIKYVLIDDSGKNSKHHYTVNSKGFVVDNIDIRKPLKVIDNHVDPDGYNSSSIAILCKESKESSSTSHRNALKDLLVKLRCHFPEAKILGVEEIGDYFIKVAPEMNALRLELSDMP